MRFEIKMAHLGYDMETGKVVRWLKAVGDAVERGQPVVEIETDKTTIEMEALQSGVLVEIVAEAGAEVEVGDVIGYLDGDE